MNDLVIFGCEFREVVKLLDAINRQAPRWRLRGFIDDRPDMRGRQIFRIPVLGDRSLLPGLAAQGIDLFNNVSGKVCNAKAVAALLEQTGRPVVSLVHPAVDLAYVELGRGAILPQGCVVGSGSVIGNYLTCRLHSVISHDVTIEDYVFVGPGAVLGSGVHLEEGVFIGAGVTVKLGCRIGRHTVVGAGALVGEDVGADMTVAGVRGRIVKAGGLD